MKRKATNSRKLDPQIFNAVNPVVGVYKLGNGCYTVKRKNLLQGELKRGERKVISMFTKKSLMRLIQTMECTDIQFKSMITLTYPNDYPTNLADVKMDLKVYCQWLRRNFDTEYLWFLEFQKRGAPHIHVLTQIAELTPTMRANAGLKWTERIANSDWFTSFFVGVFDGVVDYQQYRAEVLKMAKFNTHHKFWELEKKPRGLHHYAVWYAAKISQKEAPPDVYNLGRYWGCSKAVKLPEGELLCMDESQLRELLQVVGHKLSDAEIIPKILFNVKPSTNELDTRDTK